MPWQKANKFYENRKEETYSRIKEEYLFQEFKDFLDWRTNQAM